MGIAVKKLIVRALAEAELAWYSRSQRRFLDDLSFSEASVRFAKRNAFHAYMHHFYCHLCPPELRKHREYFKLENRGFGEDAFHAMWFALFREFRPTLCLEIGVYRGQVISLWALVSNILGVHCEIHGISPFTSTGDHVSNYLHNIDYLENTLQNHHYFDLPEPILVKGLSTDSEAVAHIRGRRWNLIYIDGSHDYEIALADYVTCRDALDVGGLLVMDDSSLYTDFHPPLFSFAGHPGPSRVVQERAMNELRYLGAVGHNNIFMKAKA